MTKIKPNRNNFGVKWVSHNNFGDGAQIEGSTMNDAKQGFRNQFPNSLLIQKKVRNLRFNKVIEIK